MKRLLIIAAIVAMAASCQKTTINAVVENPIGFSSEVGKQTKAIVSDTKYLTSQPFAVYAYGHQGNDKNTIMNNVEVSYTAASGEGATAVPEKWAASGTTKYYWPNDPRTTINFYAYSPATGTQNPKAAVANHQKLSFAQSGGVTHNETDGLTLTNYVHSNMYVDFMVGRPVIGATYGNPDGDEGTEDTENGKVPMSFNHEMTQVIFKVKTNAEYSGVNFIVNSITLNNVGNTATYTHETMTPEYEDEIIGEGNDQTTKFARGEWSAPSTINEDGYTVFPAVAITENTLDGAPGLQADQTAEPIGNAENETLTTIPVTMIPQEFGEITFDANNQVVSGEGQYFTIDYDISGTGVAAENVVKHVALKKGSHSEWKQNARVTYTISIGLNEITFLPSVISWDGEGVEHVVTPQ